MIRLDDAAVERALPLVAEGLRKYCWLQAALAATDVTHSREFQTTFDGFYRVRRGSAWRSAFFALLEREKSERRPFADVLRALHAATGRVEASFASKLVASANPDMPVIDAFVLRNLDLRLPRAGSTETRFAEVVELHDRIRRIYSEHLDGDMGRRLATSFERMYPGTGLTRVKMLDLILWKTR